MDSRALIILLSPGLSACCATPAPTTCPPCAAARPGAPPPKPAPPAIPGRPRHAGRPPTNITKPPRRLSSNCQAKLALTEEVSRLLIKPVDVNLH